MTRVSTPNELGGSIRKRRKELGFTLERLSGATGVSIRFLSELENGKKTASIGLILLVLKTLALDVDVTARGGSDV